MSSPETSTRKAKGSAKKPPAKKPAKKAAAKKAASKRAVKRDSDGLSGQDKAHFVKAMWEGISTKGAKGKKPSAKKAAEKAPAPQVEILRRIPAATTRQGPQNAASKKALAFAAEIEKAFAKGDLSALSPEAVQALMTVLCKVYGANQESGNKYPVLANRTAVTGTDVMITCGALLKAVDLQVFELGMWQSWSGV
jgi:hypothetical protein